MDFVFLTYCCVKLIVCYLFFFFKQKTAYEMRISDWSSDVCSSDLILASSVVGLFQGAITRFALLAVLMPIVSGMGGNAGTQTLAVVVRAIATNQLTDSNTVRMILREFRIALRSEEHTSELQSLMRISYAVFCLKKKKTNKTH